MALKIRLARGGSHKRPYYRIVIADVRSPRDGRFIEKIGTYNPMLPSDHADRVRLDEGRAKYWLGVGAEPTDRVARFLASRGYIDAKVQQNMIKATPKKKAQERLKAEAAAAEAAAAASESADA